MSKIKRLLLTIISFVLLLAMISGCGSSDACQHKDANDDNLCDTCGEAYSDGTDIEVHTHSFDVKLVDKDFKKSEADCTSAASYYYSCACGERGDETFTDGVATDHLFTDGVCATCNSEGTPGLVYELEGDCYTVVDAPEGALVIVIPATYKGAPVTKIKENAFSNCPYLLSVEIGANITEVSSGAFDGCVKLLEIVRSHGNDVSLVLPSTVESDAETKSNLKHYGDFWFYLYSDIELCFVHYSGTETEISLPEYLPLDEDERLRLPMMITLEDYQNSILIPLINLFEDLAEEICAQHRPDYNFRFFGNDKYESYNKYGYVLVSSFTSNYAKDVNAIAKSLSSSKSITYEEYNKLYSLRNDIFSIITNFNLYNPIEFAETIGDDALQALYEIYPITKTGVAICVYAGSTKYAVRLKFAEIIMKYLPHYSHETMLEQEMRVGWNKNDYPYYIHSLAFVGTNIIIDGEQDK